MANSSAHRKNTLAEEELLSSLSWLIKLRWFAGGGVLLATWFSAAVLGVKIPAMLLYLLGAGVLAYNALLGWGLNKLKANPNYPVVYYQWFARFQIGLDWLAMALLIQFSGGTESPALFYFLFHITLASMLLPHDRAFLYVALAPILVGGVALLEYWGVLPHVYVFEPSLYNNTLYIVGVLFFFTSAAYVMAYLSMTISRRLRRREDELTGLYQSVQATTSTLELTEVLNRLAEATTKALNCKASAIRLLDKSGLFLELAGAYGLSETYIDKDPIEIAHALIDQEALSGRTVLVTDAPHDNRLRYPNKVISEGVKTIISTPLIGKRAPIGVLRAYSGINRRFTQDDARFLGAIAAHGVEAIENARAYQILENLDRSKSQFVRMVTHELRSPVQVSLSLLNLLDKDYVGSLNEQQTDLVSRARNRLNFLQTLIDDLLDLAAGKADVLGTSKRGPVSLTGVVKGVYARFKASAEEKGLHIQMDGPNTPLNVWGDKAELDRMITNLMSNAIKYTPQGEVSVWLKQIDDSVMVVVSDTGIGIPAEAQPQLFTEFFRAGNAKTVESAGTGLGLSIVKDLAQRYNGHIRVESAEGEGTTISLTLPLAEVTAGST